MSILNLSQDFCYLKYLEITVLSM